MLNENLITKVGNAWIMTYARMILVELYCVLECCA